MPRGHVSALLAALALRVGKPVPRERLVDDLYGTRLPVSPESALYVVMTRLRGLLGKDRVTRAHSTYTLEAENLWADCDAFRRAVAAGNRLMNEGQLAESIEELERALRLWRGPALHGLTDYPFAAAGAARLDAERVAATERLMDLLLRIGRAGEAVPRLTTLAHEQPDHEEFWRLLMTALYRSGRQGEALETFRTARRHLIDELGVEPGPALLTTHAQILRQEPWPRPEPSLPWTHPAQERAEAAETATAGRRDESAAESGGFVGRYGESRRLQGLLHRHRLVTVVGAGGTGKSCLALRVADTLRRPGGVRLVELSSAQEADSITHVVARQLDLLPGISEPMAVGRELEHKVMEYVRESAPLLLLDNCEHVVGAVAAFVARVLRVAPEAKVLCTSRERLGLDEEQVLILPPLGIPPATMPPHGSLSDYESCRLFLRRARGALTERAMGARDQAAVLDICRRLDGIPLALELAVARVGVLSLHELAEELRDRIDLLGGARGDLPHHRTLRGAIEWSVHHLEPDAARVLLEMGTYPGGATLEALRHHLPGLPTARIVDALGQLVDKSLLTVDTAGGSASRYRELETVRSYCLETLEHRGELDRTLTCQLAWARDLVERTAPALLGPEMDRARAALSEEHANLLRAVREGMRAGHAEESLAVALGLIWYWRMSGLNAQTLDILSQLGDLTGLPDQMRARAHIWAGHFAYALHQPQRAVGHTRAGLALASDEPEPEAVRTRAFGLAFLGVAETRLGCPEAETHLSAAVRAAEASDDVHARGVCLLAHAIALVESGCSDAAEALLVDALTDFRRCGDGWHELRLLLRLLEVAERKGDLSRAAELAAILTERATAIRLPAMAALGRAHRAWVAALSGEDGAEPLIVRIRTRTAGLHDSEISAILEEAQAICRARAGDAAGARSAIRRALAWYRPTGQGRRVVALLRLLDSVTSGADAVRARAVIAAEALDQCEHCSDPRTAAEALQLAAGVTATHGGEEAALLRVDTAAQLGVLAATSGLWKDRGNFQALRARWLEWLGVTADGYCDGDALPCRDRRHFHRWSEPHLLDSSSRTISVATVARGNPA